MCGLAGWIATTSRVPTEGVLDAMIDTLAHRGPDGRGTYLAAAGCGTHQIALAHRRLAIIDPSRGEQPMVDRSAGVVIVYNGEIYNFQELRDELRASGHVFSTGSDTEVMLKAYRQWGDGFVDRLRGMFAFALWDVHHERLLLARDRFGEKPLFLYEAPGFLAFASEVKALLVVPGVERRLDTDALAAYLTYRYVPTPATLFRGIRKLPPGRCAEWRKGAFRQWRYYIPPDARPRRLGPPPKDPAGQFLAELDAAVGLCTVSDVPFGAFLSGGLDSSAVVALMSRHGARPVSTFSVGFDEAAYSELGYAAVIAKQFSTHHHELVVRQSDVLDDLPKLTRMRDAPVGEPSDVPIYRMSLEAAKSVKMVLTGEGSDEVLAGYPKHVYERFVPPYQRLVAPALHRLMAGIVDRLPYSQRRLQILAASFGLRDDRERMARWVGALTREEQARLSPLPMPPLLDPDIVGRPANTALRNILAFDQLSWLVDNILERGDRMTMAASIESRMPFLDVRIVDFVSSLTDEHRVRGLTTKRILRQAMRGIIPEQILARPKVGFRVPTNEWFRRRWRAPISDALIGASSPIRDFFDVKALTKLLSEHLDGRRNHEKLIWSLFALAQFQREYGLST
jgi:asparagine synthase (glutamine-hydrolysing)